MRCYAIMLLPEHILSTWQPLRVESFPARAKAVNEFRWPQTKRELPIKPKQVVAVEPYSPSIDLPVRPLSMLMRLGVVTMAPLPTAEFHMARRWALLRYFWAFADPVANAGLRLSDPAFSLVQHQRQQLSEDLGVATTLEVAGRYLLHKRPPGMRIYVEDVDVALEAGAKSGVRVRQTPGTKMRPDYFLIRRSPGQTSEIWVLECKGTHAKAASLQTLYKAAAQVGGVQLVSSEAAPPGLIGSASFSDKGIVVELLDPPGDDQWQGERAPRTSRAEPQAVVEIANDGFATVTDLPRFLRLLDDLAEARLLTLGGYGHAAAERIVEWPGRVGEETTRDLRGRTDEHRDDEFGIFHGERARLPLGSGEHLEAFIGVAREIVAGAHADEDDAIQRANERWHERISGSLDPLDGVAIVTNEPERRITIVSQDGYLMDLRTVGQLSYPASAE